jgi:hypothetical protein
MGLRMQPRSEKFFTLISKASPNVVESAAGLTEFVAAPPFRLGACSASRSTCKLTVAQKNNLKY